jgi:hypothetical protein
MANITRNFIAGRMNKVVDERLIPDGEYIDALNVRMGSTENSEIGVIENTKGNTKLTTLKYINGTALSASARCIGTITDNTNETIYWFIHDSNFPVGATGKLDMIVSFNVYNNILTYHLISINDGGGVNTTLNFNPDYLITGVNIIDNLLFFTDDYNPPRVINLDKNYPDPVGNIDQFSAESILVIKKPPVESPSVELINTGDQENFLESRFICFAYRYQYEDGEYSATSQWSDPAFQPKPFSFSINSYLNDGMQNQYNTAIVTYNTGGPLVKGIDLLFKETTSNVIKVIEKLDKAALGLLDNINETFTFTNSKIFTVLSESELSRLFDNVPLLAKAQTIMGNRLMYGNYVEGYDMIDDDGNPVELEYSTTLLSEEINNIEINDSFDFGLYNFGAIPPVFFETIPDSVVYLELDGLELVEGASITVDMTFDHYSFTGFVPSFPPETNENISLTFSFILPKSYSSVYEMAFSLEFKDAIGYLGITSNIEPVVDACDGTTFTDQFNCALSTNLGVLTKTDSGINVPGQGIGIITTPDSTQIGLQLLTMRYVDNTVSPSPSVWEYYSYSFVEAFYQKINTPRSLHSNRGYEIGIVYMDDFNRSTTALVSPNNTVHVPCSASDNKNSIQVTIPTAQKPPYWATRYKFVIKPDEDTYDTIYSSIFFNDPSTNNTYFLLEGENARKVQQGDRLIVKADTNGATNRCVYATVLEKESQVAGFVEIPSPTDPTVDIAVPAGVYIKINPNNFSTVTDYNSIVSAGTIEVDQNIQGGYPKLAYPMNIKKEAGYDPSNPTWEYEDYTVPAGSRIQINLKFQRLGVGKGNGSCETRIYTLEKTMIASANYDNMLEWFNGDNVQIILDQGIQDVGGTGCEIENEYLGTELGVYNYTTGPATSAISTPLTCTNKYRFARNTVTNELTLVMSGTVRCNGEFYREGRRSSIIATIDVFRADNIIIFETEPIDASPDIFFENELSLPIVNGFHTGNIQNQTSSVPAIIDTKFFNCFTFGNGAESYKILDSIIGRTLSLGNRVTAVAAQDYQRVRRFADITYSGVYNFESNVNKLNEFNLGLLNYKYLEVAFGPIYILDSSETNVLVLQEDKISYVLASKNLISDSSGGGTIASIPQILGTQIARTEEYGISFHPESYVQWGPDKFFTDVKRGAVLNLKGDQLIVISEFGMRTWFRDEFIESFNTQKLGGYDPYLNEYVLTTNSEELPIPIDCIACGVSQTFTIPTGNTFSYCVDLGQPVGVTNINYSVPAGSSSNFTISVTYDGNVVTSGLVSTSGSLQFEKDKNNVNVATITIVASGPLEITVVPNCPIQETLTIVKVTLTSVVDAGKFIHNEYRYTDGTYVSPLQSTFVTFAVDDSSPVVSQYEIISGPQGFGGIPTNGSNLQIISNKIVPDTFDFVLGQDKFRYLRSNTLYPNTSVGISGLLAASTVVSPITGSSGFYSGTFSVPISGNYLYLIWDYRNSLSVNLCYSNTTTQDACCGCEEPT